MDSPTQARPSLLTVFRHRNYRLFFAGQLLSLMGTWMQTIAQAWLVYRLTGSPLALGFVTFAAQAPVFFFTAFGGTIADRVDKRRAILAAQSLLCMLAVALSVLTFTEHVTFAMVAGLAFFFGLVNAVEIPTRQSFIVDMVGKDDLQSAIALNSMMFNTARIVGPAAAGVIVAWVGEAWCFALNAVSYLAVIASLALMNVISPVRVSRARALQELREGFAYVSRHREIRAALLALAASSFAGGGSSCETRSFAPFLAAAPAAPSASPATRTRMVAIPSLPLIPTVVSLRDARWLCGIHTSRGAA